MATIGKDKRGKRVRYRVLFVAEDGSRRTIRLGNASRRQAEALAYGFAEGIELVQQAVILCYRIAGDCQQQRGYQDGTEGLSK